MFNNIINENLGNEGNNQVEGGGLGRHAIGTKIVEEHEMSRPLEPEVLYMTSPKWCTCMYNRLRDAM